MTGARNPAGFVKFSSIETATEALEALNGSQTPEGETLAVSYARPRKTQFSGYSENSRQGSSGSFNRRSAPRWNNER